MPALPNVAGALKVQQGWSEVSDTGAMTVFHLAYTGGPPSAAQCATMAATIQGHAVTRFAGLLNTGSVVGLATVLDLSSDMGGEGTGGTGSAGTRTGGILAPATSVVVSKSVARHYRGGHPRSYLPFGVVTDIGVGVWGSTFAGNVKTAWDNFMTDCIASGSGCAITGEISVSYFHAGAVRVTPVKDPITGTHVGVKIGSQRRRNRHQ